MTRTGWVGICVFVGASGIAVAASLWKLFVIGSVAFLAMAGGTWLGIRSTPAAAEIGVDPVRRLVWGYGLTSGAMITSTAVFLVPNAIGQHAHAGGFGIAAGILTGYALHVAQHHLAHLSLPYDGATMELTAHALAGGLVIGAVYATMPTLGLMLGLAIVSHKGPAGYAAATRLCRNGRAASVLLVPSAAVAVTAVPVGLLSPPTSPITQALIFGIATGIFLHVALDFLPQCEIGSELLESAGWSEQPPQADSGFDDHHYLLDRLRLHAVASTVMGGGVIFLAWWTLSRW